MFKPDMNAIRDWVASGQMKSDLDDATREALKETIPETLRAFSRLWASRDGQTVLAYLAEVAVLRPPVNHMLPEGQYLRYAQLREGHQQLFATILECTALGDQLMKGQPDGRSKRNDTNRRHVPDLEPDLRPDLAGYGGRASDGDVLDGPGWSGFDPDPNGHVHLGD